MFFRTIKRDLHVSTDRREMPAEPSTAETGFEPAVPKDRTDRIGGRTVFHDGDGLRPESRRLVGSSCMSPCIEKGHHLTQRNLLLQPGQAKPNLLRRFHVIRIG